MGVINDAWCTSMASNHYGRTAHVRQATMRGNARGREREREREREKEKEGGREQEGVEMQRVH